VAWLDENDVRYTPSVKFTGMSGYDQRFDFAIPKSRKQPERIVQAINRTTRDSALQFINAWGDTRQVRTSALTRNYRGMRAKAYPVARLRWDDNVSLTCDLQTNRWH
jgi:hypothetical protein